MAAGAAVLTPAAASNGPHAAAAKSCARFSRCGSVSIARFVSGCDSPHPSDTSESRDIAVSIRNHSNLRLSLHNVLALQPDARFCLGATPWAFWRCAGTKSIPLAAIAVLLSLPGFVVKQIINCFQLKSSMQALVAYDQERESTKTD